MLFLGRQRQRTCQTLSRRAFLQAGGSSVLGLTLADWLQWRAMGGTSAGVARSVIFVWLWGGPSHLDTWDPKPEAPLDYRGPFSTIPTKVPGLRLCELFPKLADAAPHFSVVRSLHTGSNDHGIAGTIGLTGSDSGSVGLGDQAKAGNARPATGSVVARVRGAHPPLPSFMVVGGKLHQGKKTIAGEGGGALGALCDPFRIEYEKAGKFNIPALELPAHLTPERLADRRSLLAAFDGARRHTEQLQQAHALDEYREQAFTLLTSPEARKIFDLSLEPAANIDRYGQTRFGRCCLLARRLVEQGAPFVQVNWSDHVEAEEDSGDGGWDHHYRNFQIMQDRQAAWLDQALSCLLGDLHQRGLLETTLVVVVGEFGRSPKINASAGRDHWEHCYSALLAGGGVRGGRIIGASDARGEHPHDVPVTPADLAGTVHQCVGITSEQAATLGIAVNGKPIHQLF
jgi:hypothetical protein